MLEESVLLPMKLHRDTRLTETALATRPARVVSRPVGHSVVHGPFLHHACKLRFVVDDPATNARERDRRAMESSLSRGEIGTPFLKMLGLRSKVIDHANGVVAVGLDISDDLRGPGGTLDDGVVSTIVDVAGASAVGLKAGPVATEQVSISFIAPGRVGPIRATASPLRVGAHDGVSEVKVIDTGMQDRLMAVGTVTVRILDEA
jgi:uncharacterized protein (TIGR00369 family)